MNVRLALAKWFLLAAPALSYVRNRSHELQAARLSLGRTAHDLQVFNGLVWHEQSMFELERSFLD